MTGTPRATRSLDDLCGSRRDLLRGLAAVGVTTIAAGVLVACGSEAQVDEEVTVGGGEGEGATDGATGGGASAEASVPLADVPVGEAVVVEALGTRFVVAQPSEGEVVAFSAACTHEGTPVEAAGGTELRCPNHGSRFDATDGAVLQGPATSPLQAVDARVEGDQVVLSA